MTNETKEPERIWVEAQHTRGEDIEYVRADLSGAKDARITELETKLAKALETMTEVRNDCIARADKNNVVPIGRGAWDHLTAALAELKGTE